MLGVADLSADVVREALRHLGATDHDIRVASRKALRERFLTPGFVAEVVSRGPAGTEAAFGRLVVDGADSVEEVLGRGWAGVGQLPDPLGWLQRRGLVILGPAGLVHAVEEARKGYATMTFDLHVADPGEGPQVRVVETRSVVTAEDEAALDETLHLAGANRLLKIAPTVAISHLPWESLTSALESVGVRPLTPVADEEHHGHIDVAGDEAAAGAAHLPLPGVEETAVGPRAIRAMITRALEEARQLRLEYFASSRGGQGTERVVDPWSFDDGLLRGWCHLRGGERTFALDRIGRAKLLTTPRDRTPV